MSNNLAFFMYTRYNNTDCVNKNLRTKQERGCRQMKKKMLSKVLKGAAALLIVSAMISEAVVSPLAGVLGHNTSNGLSSVLGNNGSKHEASSIQKVEDIKIDYEKFLDSSKVLELPGHIKDSEEISVIITVDVMNLMDAYEGTDRVMSFAEYALTSDEAADIEAKIAEKKAEILSKLDEKGVAYKTGSDYSRLLSGFEITIKAGDFKATCQSLDDRTGVIVSEVYKVAKTELVENKVNVFDTGIFDSSDSGYDGTGMVVAVLDTGLESNHSAFSPNNFTSKKLGLTYDDVSKVINDTVASTLMTGLTADNVYINEKVPYGFDYADKDPDVYATHNNHGTHVSGVIVGNDDTIRGVAPNAQLVSMKIFSDVYDTAVASWILTALEDCVVLGVDVINMSLGTACGFSRESDEEMMNGVYDKIRDAGISMIVAASNSYSSAYGSEANGNLGLTSNPDTGTVGSPSTYKGVMSVASISGVETPYLKYGKTIIYFTEANSASGDEKDFVATLLGDKKSAEIEYVVIPGVGRTADYTGLDVKNKIVLVRRGSNTFEEKAIIAQEQGAAGIIIYNNVSGDIKMNVGTTTLAVCSISQDEGEMLAAKGNGKLKISVDQTSGPFISDFSSWGPTPDLGIKPEITAHGGSILSAVTGGGYDRLSGTSMACPNLAGVVILLRQYVVENFKDIANDPVAVNAMVYKLLMSTADIALGKNGNPYAVRKQGAGLANLMSSIKTTAYLTTYDKDGKEMDKTKLELGDDPSKKGVYEFKFTINNFGNKSLTYDLGAYVMTEGVSDTKTNAGLTTVTEESVILDGAKIEILSVDGGKLKGSQVTVDGGKDATVTMKISLTKENKKYLDKSFENGMYVEGFVTLKAKKGTDIDLNIPYLAFYGDWTVAPLWDKDYYETNPDELDDGISDEDKTKPDAYATRPIGGVSEDYVSYLGSYYFIQNPEEIAIPAMREHVSLSNQEGTIHSLRYVWAGLLRNAAKIEVKITDDVTGEVIFETTDTDVRKSYGDGGSIYPANVEIEFDTLDFNLKNNSKYTVTLTGYLDYGKDGGLTTNKKTTFQFPLTIDFEAPTVSDVEFYYEYDNTLKKNRLYAKVAVYDNHYAMSGQLGYIVSGQDENGNPIPELKPFSQYMTPIYSQENSTTYVTYELTDYIYQLKEDTINKNTFVLTVYDYALNYATYEIGLPIDYTDFYFDSLDEGLVISPNEVYSLEPLIYPSTEWAELLQFTSSRPSVVRVVNNKLVGVNSGKAVIKAQDPTTGKSVTFEVVVLKEGDEGYRKYDKPVADIFRVDGFYTMKAYYILDSNEKEIGDTGSTNFFTSGYDLTLYPSESVVLNCTLDAYFPNDTTLSFETSNEDIVTVNESGVVTAVAEGFASITVKVLLDGKSTYYSETISVEVKDQFITMGASLSHYYGLGGVVTIPTRLSLKEIGAFAFSNFDYVAKTEEDLLFDDQSVTKQWFIGDSTVTKVIIPEGVEKIGAYAFANLTALEEIVLPSTLESIDYGAFYGCTALEKISFSGENNLKIINQNAFENCNLKGTLDLSKAFVISDYAFAGNQRLEEVITADKLISIGQYAFAGCKKLTNVTITVDTVKYGAYCFTGCESLTSFYVNASVLPEGMFYECKSMTSVKIGPNVNDIEPFAFRDTKIALFEIDSANKAFKVQNADYVISADGTKLIAVSPVVAGEFTASNIGNASVSVIAKGAFSHNTKITSVVLDKVTSVGEYGLASNKALTSITLGTLTNIGEYAFFEAGITKLPAMAEGVQIPNYAFACTALTSVAIPDGMVIGEGAFSDCLNMTNIVIGNNVTIGNHAFSTDKDKAFKTLYYTEGGKRYYYYEFASALNSLTIGENAKIGENAFAYAASIKNITLGANAEIGKMAFYNAVSLENIDLSKALTIGDYAFSGDVYYICLDENMTVAAVSKDGQYIYSYHGPALKSVNLSSATSIGKNSFSYCRDMKSVVLGSGITVIPEYAFAGCIKLESVNLENVKTIEQYGFMETDLRNVDVSATETIGDYGFVSNKNLSGLKLNPNGVDIGEGTFSYCEKLSKVENIQFAKNIGEYAFAYTTITNVDLSGAVSIGTHAFIKEKLTPFTVKLGANLEKLGDNPFAMCKIEPFHIVETENFAGIDYNKNIYTFDISEKVKVVDGSLYCIIDTGYELITYAGTNNTNVNILEDTVRITSMAFAGSDVEIVTLPYTVASIGHKAFYGCDKLDIMTFASYNAPILEEEFDPAYYNSLEHIPGSGDYGNYTDYDGTEKKIVGMNLIPFYMWNVSSEMFSNVFYGANFVDYVGYVEDKMIMIRPVNGQNYDSYVMDQYFDIVLDGSTAADKITLAAIKAIKAIPERVTYNDKALVEAARAAYSKIATTEQQALVKNYSDLITAEQRIKALTPADEDKTGPENKADNTGLIIALVVLIIVLAITVSYYLFRPQIDDAVKAYLADRKDPEKKAKRAADKAAKKETAAKKAAEKKAAKKEADAAKKAAKAEKKAVNEAEEASEEGDSNEKEN